MTITLYQESRMTGKQKVCYFVTLHSDHHHYCRKVSKESWLAILDHLWLNPMFYRSDFGFRESNNGKVAVWIDEFKEV